MLRTRTRSRFAAVAAIAAIAGAPIASPVHAGQAAPKKSGHAKPKAPAGQKKATFPADRDAAVVAVTRAVLAGIYAGKVDPALTTPDMRAKYPPGKVRSLQKDLKSYGPLRTVKLVERKPGDGKDVATLKITLGETVFIGTMTITNDNRMDTFLLLEE